MRSWVRAHVRNLGSVVGDLHALALHSIGEHRDHRLGGLTRKAASATTIADLGVEDDDTPECVSSSEVWSSRTS